LTLAGMATSYEDVYGGGTRLFNDQRSSSDRATEKEMPLAVLVDTVLLKSYLLTGGDLAMAFLQQRNECDMHEAEVRLV